MDIVGIIRKSYRSYGSLISDDFIAFLRETSQNNVSLRKKSYRFFLQINQIAIYLFLSLDMD